mgnify:FL=1
MGVKYNFQFRLSQPWKEVEAVFACNPDAFGRLMAKITKRDPSVQLETMTVKSMLEAVGGGVPSELRARYADATVVEWCAMVNSLRDALQAFTEFLERTVPPVTAYSKKMSSGTLKGNIEEAVLWTLRESFGLQSLEQAHNLTVYEYMVARKSVYNDAVVAYNKDMDMASRSAAARG